MPWPLPQDYNEAIRNPTSCFADTELRQTVARCNALELPMPCSGNFADVYEMTGPAGKKWAVKCFTRQVPGLRERYAAISAYLQQVALPFMVDFDYLEQGIQVKGQWYPILKMHWVEGVGLNQFIGQNADNPVLLQATADIWLKVARRLREARMAHCDLQHGNVLLVPGKRDGAVSVRLIDYDGMFVPALVNTRSGEVGHAAFQHPQRLRDGTYNAAVDRFPHLVIYTALRSLVVCGSSLWKRYDNGDNLLFRQHDLAAPAQSPLVRELLQVDDGELRRLLDQLSRSVHKPLEQTPLLDDLISSGPSSAVTLRPRSRGDRRPESSIASAAAGDSSAPHSGDSPRGREGSRRPVGVTTGLRPLHLLSIAAAMVFAVGVIVMVTALQFSAVREHRAEADEVPQSVDLEPQAIKPPEPASHREKAEKGTEGARQQQKPGNEGRVVAPVPVVTVLCPARLDPRNQLTTTPLNTLAGHADLIKTIAFSPDGRILVTGSKDRTARLWSVPDGKLLAILDGHGDEIESVAVSPDGRLVATGSKDQTARLWSIPDGRPVATLVGHAKHVHRVAFSPNGRILATRSCDATARLWSVPDGQRLATLSGHKGEVLSIAFSPDGQTLATGGVDGSVRLWSVPEGGHVATLPVDDDSVVAGFSSDGSRLLTITWRRFTVQLWSVSERKRLGSFDGRAQQATSIDYSFRDHLVATGGEDGTVRLWSFADGKLLTTLSGHTAGVTNVVFSPDARMLATSGKDKTVRFWSMPDGVPLTTSAAPQERVWFGFGPDGRTQVTVSTNNAELWHYDVGQGLDWSGKATTARPVPRALSSGLGAGVVYAGDTAWIDLTLENNGEGDLLQLWAGAEINSPRLRMVGARFGRVPAGARLRRRIGVVLPPDHPAGFFQGQLVFHEANGHVPAAQPLAFEVRPLPRPDFPFTVTRTVAGTGTPAGNATDPVRRGETLDVAVAVDNRTGAPLEGLFLSLQPVGLADGVVLQVARADLGNIAHEGRAEGRVRFTVNKDAGANAAKLELRVQAADGRVFVVQPVDVKIE